MTITVIKTLSKVNSCQFIGSLRNSGRLISQIDLLSFISAYLYKYTLPYLINEGRKTASKNNDDDQYIWSSTSDSKFTIAKDLRGNVHQLVMANS